MSAWSFGRRHGTCAGCEREFEPAEPHYSSLLVDQDQLAREDLCRACWRERGAPAPREAAQGADAEPSPWVFWWRTRHEVGKKKGLALNLEAIEALFMGLEGRTVRRLRELRYVLCLLLMRKRRLKIVRILRDAEGESMLVRRPRRQEQLRVFVFDFDAQRMGELREELLHVFDSEEGLASLSAGEAEGIDSAGSDEDGLEDPGVESEDEQAAEVGAS